VSIWYDWSSVAALALPRSVKKIGWEHISYGEATATWHRIRSKTYPYLDAVVSLTQEDCPAFKRVSRHVRCIPNYVEAVVPGPSADREDILLTIGHLIPRKGLDRLLWALKRPLQDNPGWKLVVVGGGEKGHADRRHLYWVSTLMQLLQLQGRVEFYPATDEIEAWYRRASIYVMGSRREGLPMVLIEAKAHGLPVVAFDCPTGPKEIIRSGIDGILVDNDSNEFGESVSKLMHDAELRDRMGAAGVEDVKQRFSMHLAVREWLDLIESLHSAKGRV
jgi:glycosyltransferase involved in cell wall biosynthesis